MNLEDGIFRPGRFSGWPELKETYLANRLEATSIQAPLGISLREQGVPPKIMHLGRPVAGVRGLDRLRLSVWSTGPNPGLRASVWSTEASAKSLGRLLLS